MLCIFLKDLYLFICDSPVIVFSKRLLALTLLISKSSFYITNCKYIFIHAINILPNYSLPFLFVYVYFLSEVKWSLSVVFDSLLTHGLEPTRLLPWDFPGKNEYWSGLPFPSSEDLPNSGIEPRSPALQADSLPTELRDYIPNVTWDFI